MAGLLDLLSGLGINPGPMATQNGEVLGPADGGQGILAQFSQRLRNASPELTGFGMGMLSGATPQEGWANAAQGMQSQRQQANRNTLLAQAEQDRKAKTTAAQNFLKAHPDYAQKYGADASDPEFVQRLAAQQASNDMSPDKFDRITGADGSVYAVNKSDPNDVRKIPIAPAAAQWTPVQMDDGNGNKRTIFQRGGQFATGEQLGIPGGPAPTNPYAAPGKNSQDMSQAATYADRASRAHEIVTANEGINQGGLGGVGPMIANALPNGMQSADRQSFNQAKTNFMTAILRKESGAAISQGEFDTEDKKYFPQPGDDPKTIAQKREAREIAIRGLMREAGPGYTPPDNWKSGTPQLQSGAKSDGPKPPSNAVQIRSVDDYNKLPKGSPYIDPNGRQRVKQ